MFNKTDDSVNGWCANIFDHFCLLPEFFDFILNSSNFSIDRYFIGFEHGWTRGICFEQGLCLHLMQPNEKSSLFHRSADIELSAYAMPVYVCVFAWMHYYWCVWNCMLWKIANIFAFGWDETHMKPFQLETTTERVKFWAHYY